MKITKIGLAVLALFAFVNVVFYPANQTLRLGVEAADILIDGGANDVRPSYFFGNLNARIYPN